MVSETSLKQVRSISKGSGKYLTEEIKTDCPDNVCGLVNKKKKKNFNSSILSKPVEEPAVATKNAKMGFHACMAVQSWGAH